MSEIEKMMQNANIKQNRMCEWTCKDNDLCNVRGKVRTEKTARNVGWIITADGKHFDTKECYCKYKKGILG